MIALATTPPKAYPDDSSPCSATTTLGSVVTKAIISRKEAKEQGLTRYFTGKACPQKHTSERHTSNGKCRGCASNKKEKMKMQGTRYFGKICEKHPELNGERRTSNSGCVKCVYLRSNDPKYRVRKNIRGAEHMAELRKNPEFKSKEAAYKRIYSAERYKNPDVRSRINMCRNERCKNDFLFNMIDRSRTRIKLAFRNRGFTKKSKASEILGCSWQELKEYIESKFVDGMNWENRHLWHIDHKIPLATAKTEEGVYKLCHYTNLQPLWAEDNLRKGSKLIEALL